MTKQEISELAPFDYVSEEIFEDEHWFKFGCHNGLHFYITLFKDDGSIALNAFLNKELICCFDSFDKSDIYEKIRQTTQKAPAK